MAAKRSLERKSDTGDVGRRVLAKLKRLELLLDNNEKYKTFQNEIVVFQT